MFHKDRNLSILPLSLLAKDSGWGWLLGRHVVFNDTLSTPTPPPACDSHTLALDMLISHLNLAAGIEEWIKNSIFRHECLYKFRC